MSRIGVLTLQFGEIPYAKFSSAINEAYCRRHGYQWIVTSPDDPPRPDRNPIWYKVRRAADALPNFDFVLYLDADAWFYDQGRRVESLIDQFMTERTLLLCGANDEWDGKDANTGVFLVRNTPLSKHIMEEWWHVPCYDKHSGFGWPIEQQGFNWHIRSRWYDDGRIVTVPGREMNCRDGVFIRHLAGFPNDARSEILAKELEKVAASVDEA